MSEQLIQLNKRFRQPNAFDSLGGYSLLPFTFGKLGDDTDLYVLFNLVGEHIVISGDVLPEIIEKRLPSSNHYYDELVSKGFVLPANQYSTLDLLAAKYRTKRLSLGVGPALHIFVVTLRCDHSCPYCQVSRVSENREAHDMSLATAELALRAVFLTPSAVVKIEFQGGESLLNFELIKYIVNRALEMNESACKDLEFVAATNLSPLTDEILDFFAEHQVLVSTSIDGPSWLHNKNRPRPGRDSYEREVSGISRVRERLGFDKVSALMTTTRTSLDHVTEIIDEYIRLEFDSIFLRWLSPFGFAVKSQRAIGYPTEEFCKFYERGLRYILELNKRGVKFREDYSAIVMKRILLPYETGYVDLASPSGIGSSVIVYNYDGDVYASDESRMLAESNDKTFRLGNLYTDTYQELFASDKLKRWMGDTMVEATPMCSDCQFQTICGTDPVLHHSMQGDYVGHRPTSAFCQRQMFVMNTLIKILHTEPENAQILREWAYT
jgi:uncharacterized protein